MVSKFQCIFKQMVIFQKKKKKMKKYLCIILDEKTKKNPGPQDYIFKPWLNEYVSIFLKSNGIINDYNFEITIESYNIKIRLCNQ